VLTAVTGAGYLLVYPETVPVFGVAFVLYHLRHVTDAGFEWKSLARTLLVLLISCVLLGPYSIGCVFFLLSQFDTSVTQGLYDGGSIFSYFLLPNGTAVLFGMSRLGELLAEPWLSLSIAAGLLLLIA